MVEMKLRFLIDILSYSYFIVLSIISVCGAIYTPALGIITCLGLAAYFFDYNKKIYGKFLISPQIFFDKERVLRPYHKLLFYLFSASLLVNLFFGFLRLAKPA